MSTPLDVSSLIYAIEAGNAFTYRFFWGHRPRADGRLSDACFSQWWSCRFEIDGQSYTTAEQWMMASKARMFGDDDVAQQIMATDDPDKIKATGRRVRGFAQEAWDAACFGLVTAGNVAKFGQDARLKKYLQSTGDDVLVEASPTDTLWGIGLHRDAPDAANPKAWRGLNLLGFALMRARCVLRGGMGACTPG